MNVEEQRGIISSVVAFTLTLVLLAFVLFCTVLSLFFTRTYADLLYSIGLRNLSLSAYEYNYKTSNDINDLYLLLSRSIVAGNDEYIVKSYESLERRDEYDDFIIFLENSHFANCKSTLEMLYLSNEDNYLRGKYVVALKTFKSVDIACDYAFEQLTQTQVTTSYDRVNFVFGYLISSFTSAEQFACLTDEIKNGIYNYYEQLYNIYKAEFSQLKPEGNDNYTLDKFQLLKLNYRISDIYYAMNAIDMAVGMGIDLNEAKQEVVKLADDFAKLL